MRRSGWTVGVLSGDRAAAVQAVAREVGIDRAVGELLPEGKVEEVRRLQAEGHRVAFIGDGIKRRGALAQADLGIALAPARRAMEAATSSSWARLRLVADALGLARRTFCHRGEPCLGVSPTTCS